MEILLAMAVLIVGSGCFLWAAHSTGKKLERETALRERLDKIAADVAVIRATVERSTRST